MLKKMTFYDIFHYFWPHKFLIIKASIMKVGKNNVVTLTYTVHKNDKDGEVIQKVDETRPFVHLFGVGTLLPAFEENLEGLEPGGEFGFSLTAEQGYGTPNDQMIFELEKKIFEIDGVMDENLVKEGNTITMQDQNGQPIDGKVLAVKDNSVIMDFNHPLAGENLFFEGKVIDVREATEEEQAHGHVHGDGGHQH
jgi:FKBP-type peptidyl-prolyl cis-trans isomerase SlyD